MCLKLCYAKLWLQSHQDPGIEMSQQSSGRCFYFFYTHFMSERLSSRHSLKSDYLEDIIQLPKYSKQTWSWVFDILVLRWIKEILNDKNTSTGLGCRNTRSGRNNLGHQDQILIPWSRHSTRSSHQTTHESSYRSTFPLQQIHYLCNRRPKAIKPTSHRKRTGEKHH